MNKELPPKIEGNPGEDPEWTYCHHAVAFLDLMGQRQIFNDLPGVPDNEVDNARLIEKIRDTVGYIGIFRKGFSDMFGALQSDRKIPEQVPVEFYSEWRRMQKTEIHLQSVSDAVIAWTPIRPVDEPGMAQAMNGLWGILMTAAGMTLQALAAKHPLRGGIDLDGGITIDPGGNEIYGRALNCAYELESIQAKSPRILIGPGVIAFLETIETDSEGTRCMAYAKKLVDRCRGLITNDEDGKPMLHFLGASAREVVNLPEFRAVGIDGAHKFIKDSAEKFKDDQKLGPRYALLLRYFEKNIRDWDWRKAVR